MFDNFLWVVVHVTWILILFFFLRWTILKALIEFVTMLPLFSGFFFFCCKALFDQKLNPCLLHWKVKYSPLDHQRSPQILILTWPITQIAFYVDSKQSSQNQNGVVGVMREKSLFLEEAHLKLMELTAIVFISSSSPYHFKTFLACHLDITFTQVLRRKLRCLIIMQIRQNRHIFDRRIN